MCWPLFKAPWLILLPSNPLGELLESSFYGCENGGSPWGGNLPKLPKYKVAELRFEPSSVGILEKIYSNRHTSWVLTLTQQLARGLHCIGSSVPTSTPVASFDMGKLNHREVESVISGEGHSRDLSPESLRPGANVYNPCDLHLASTPREGRGLSHRPRPHLLPGIPTLT